jgi:hypothetical protein
MFRKVHEKKVKEAGNQIKKWDKLDNKYCILNFSTTVGPSMIKGKGDSSVMNKL